MGLVSTLRFDGCRGAMLASEESWTSRFQRRFHRVVLHPLLTEEQADAWACEVAYGGAGHEGLHDGVVEGTRRELAKRFLAWKKARGKKDPAPTVRDVGECAARVLQVMLHRRADQRLRFYYGFDTKAVHRGKAQLDERIVPLTNATIRERARKVMAGREDDPISKKIRESRATLAGFDAVKGFEVYDLRGESGNLAFVYEGWEAIGHGLYGAAIPLGKLLNHRDFADRLQGPPATEGLYTLVEAGLMAAEHYYQTERDFSILLMDGKGRKRHERLRELDDEVSRLVTETVMAAGRNYLRRSDALELVERLAFDGAPFEEIEAELFRRSEAPEALELLLRGYKDGDIPSLILPPPEEKKAAPSPRRKGGRR